MKYCYTILIALCFSSQSFAKLNAEALKCQFDINGKHRKEIPIALGFPSNLKITEIEGFKIGATFSPGDMFESQQLLAMSMNGITSTVYDPKDSLYVLNDESGMARFQCWVENK
jgi:hypothetical protein